MTKGYAIGSAGLAALVLFAVYTEDLGHYFPHLDIRFELQSPFVVIGLFLGGLMPYLFGALGMMAVGKSTIGRIVAKKHNLIFIDTDANIKKKNSMTIAEIFTKKGENFFREEEEKVVLKSLKKNNCVIALGGGAFINKTVRENILKNAISIW